MPHRIGFLWEKMVSEENCIAAELEMTRRKKNNDMAMHVRQYAERYGKQLSEKLRSDSYMFHECRNVSIHDSYKGKTRHLQIPVLEDQAAQQAWLLVAIPELKRRGYYYSCSSIPGSGPLRAVKMIQKRMNKKKHPTWGCTIDLRKFFESCPHWVVRRGLRRIFKDRRFIEFANRCMLAMNPDGVGIAIGHPISPWLANLALTEIDYMLKEYYPEIDTARYMDDILMIGRNKRKIYKAVNMLCRNLKVRCMKVKDCWEIRKLSSVGVSYLSYRFFPHHTMLRKPLMRRIIRKMRRCRNNLSVHNARSVISYMGILKHCNSFHFRVKYVYPYVNPDMCRRIISHADNQNRKQNAERIHLAAA